jgi:hypothetical protein
MPLPLAAGDLLAGAMRGTAEALRVIAAGRTSTVAKGGEAKTEAVTEAEYQEMLKLQKASEK